VLHYRNKGDFMVRLATRIVAVLFTLSLTGASAPAQDRRQNQPGKFDFYVLSLSWSPSFCEATAERGRESREQCGARPFSFVVHGFWPQYERGFPEFCRVPSPRIDRNLVNAMLDLMPAPPLVFHEWDKHGTCSGLEPKAYFETVRKARAVVKIPEGYLELNRIKTVTPNEVEEEFVKANPGLPRDAIAITCDNRRLQEVRICMSKELGFQSCPEVDRRGICRRDRVVMPPVRGGSR
jgi:ribonuclease T2